MCFPGADSEMLNCWATGDTVRKEPSVKPQTSTLTTFSKKGSLLADDGQLTEGRVRPARLETGHWTSEVQTASTVLHILQPLRKPPVDEWSPSFSSGLDSLHTSPGTSCHREQEGRAGAASRDPISFRNERTQHPEFFSRLRVVGKWQFSKRKFSCY